jgi:hypothetical protein
MDEHPPWTKFDPSDLKPAPTWMKNPVPCPVCKGHTKCIIIEHYFGTGEHQKYECSQCGHMHPYGWVEADSKNASCVHTYVFQKKLGHNYIQKVCSKCNHTTQIDSGD